MALNNEDKKDVQKHMGKALANKVSGVTRDYATAKPTNASLKRGKHHTGSNFNARTSYENYARSIRMDKKSYPVGKPKPNS